MGVNGWSNGSYMSNPLGSRLVPLRPMPGSGEISLPSTLHAAPQRGREDWKWFRTGEKVMLNKV